MLTLLFIKLYSLYQWWIQGREPGSPPPPPTFLDHTEAYCLAAFAFKLKLLVHSTYTQLFETPINITPAPPQYHQTFKLVGKWEVLVGI